MATSQKSRFAVCVVAKPDEDLIVGKAYQILPDKAAEETACLRAVDESGEDYLYPATRFVIIAVRQPERPRLLKAVKRRSA